MHKTLPDHIVITSRLFGINMRQGVYCWQYCDIVLTHPGDTWAIPSSPQKGHQWHTKVKISCNSDFMNQWIIFNRLWPRLAYKSIGTPHTAVSFKVLPSHGWWFYRSCIIYSSIRSISCFLYTREFPKIIRGWRKAGENNSWTLGEGQWPPAFSIYWGEMIT